ncbi:MAG: nucleotidyltransferase domain-containing protein [Candidatus Eremiobacteraeota bacterium]|nr:nucleotidyltransferase domain-containing protein [Candidatus Eremiobacteraeota bacterium]
MKEEEFWERNLILRVLCGSRAYGLAGDDSDEDTRGICIPPREFLLGLRTFDQHESIGHDHVVYSLAKFVRLALQGNPNIIETLFADPEHVLFVNAPGGRLLEGRRIFLSRRVGERFSSYAAAQLKRIERHHRWLQSPPERQPSPADFGAEMVEGRYRFPHLDAEHHYQAAIKHWNHYLAWRRNRNAARAKLEELYGYDTKHAMHLCRLLVMGQEILATGEVLVKRPDAEWLKRIRQGAMSYEELVQWSSQQEALLPRLMNESPLPEEPDIEAAEELVIALHWDFLKGDGSAEGLSEVPR